MDVTPTSVEPPEMINRIDTARAQSQVQIGLMEGAPAILGNIIVVGPGFELRDHVGAFVTADRRASFPLVTSPLGQGFNELLVSVRSNVDVALSAR